MRDPSIALHNALVKTDLAAAKKAIANGGRTSLFTAESFAPEFMIENQGAVIRTDDDCYFLVDRNRGHGRFTSKQLSFFKHFCVAEPLDEVRRRLAQVAVDIQALPDGSIQRCVSEHQGRRPAYARELAKFRSGVPNDDLERCGFDYCGEHSRFVLASGSAEHFREHVSMTCVEKSVSPEARRLGREAARYYAVVEATP